MGAPTGLLPSFLAAIQASLSVLLVIFYGALAARLNLLTRASAKALSQICVKMFLPALLLTQIGAELRAGSAHRYALVLAWALACHALSFALGAVAHAWLGLPDWVTAALMFNNTTSYPLLLIQSLGETGILRELEGGNKEGGGAGGIERAKSYFLVFATVSSCLTFAVGPRLVDSEHSPDEEEGEEGKSGDEDDGEDGEVRAGEEEESSRRAEAGEANGSSDQPISETTQLLGPQRTRRVSVAPTSFYPSLARHRDASPIISTRRPSVIARRTWHRLSDRARWWLLFFYDFLNAPLLGALAGTLIGLVPALQRAFFAAPAAGGIFAAWLTPSLKNIGGIFVPLPVIVAGVSLYLSVRQPHTDDTSTTNSRRSGRGSGSSNTPWATTAFILGVRFVLWPVLSVGAVYLLATRTTWLGTDPMLWFAMMLMPTGPSAMKLIAMVEVSGASAADEQRIARLLTISYVISPVLAFTVVGSLRASLAAMG